MSLEVRAGMLKWFLTEALIFSRRQEVSWSSRWEGLGVERAEGLEPLLRRWEGERQSW